MANKDSSGISFVVKSTQSCELCDKLTTSGANCYCLQCAVYLCDLCLKGHTKIPITNHHTYAVSAPVCATTTAVGSTGAAASAPPSTISSPDTGSGAYSLCLAHDVRQKHYCRVCSKALCSECVVEEHKDHETVKIEVQIEAVRQRLDEERVEVDRLLTQEQQKHTDFNEALQDFNQHEKRVRSLLENQKREEMKRIELKFKAVEDENESRANTFTASVSIDIKTLESRIAELKYAIKQIADLKTHVTGSCRSDAVNVTTPDVSAPVRIAAAPHPELIDSVESQGSSCSTQTDLCSKNGRVTFRRRVSDLEVGELHYGDEITINHIPWLISVQRLRNGRIGVFFEADRHDSVPRGWRVSAECRGGVVHPTDTSKNLTQNHSRTFTRESRCCGFDVWRFEEEVVAGGLTNDGFVSVDIRVETTGVERLPPCSHCGH